MALPVPSADAIIPYDRAHIMQMQQALRQELQTQRDRHHQQGVVVDIHYRTYDQDDWLFARTVLVQRNHELEFHIVEGDGEGTTLKLTTRATSRSSDFPFDILAAERLTKCIVESSLRAAAMAQASIAELTRRPAMYVEIAVVSSPIDRRRRRLNAARSLQ